MTITIPLVDMVPQAVEIDGSFEELAGLGKEAIKLFSKPEELGVDVQDALAEGAKVWFQETLGDSREEILEFLGQVMFKTMASDRSPSQEPPSAPKSEPVTDPFTAAPDTFPAPSE